MKSLWNSFKIAFSMFSKIPVPQAEWTEENMKYMLCFFPFIGTAIGIVFLVAEWICRYSGVRKFIYGNGTGSCAGDPHRWNSYRRTSGYFRCLEFLA